MNTQQSRKALRSDILSTVESVNEKFITLKEMVQDYVDRQYAGKDLGRMSCEDIAHDILNHFSILDKVSIAEDGENGATLWRA